PSPLKRLRTASSSFLIGSYFFFIPATTVVASSDWQMVKEMTGLRTSASGENEVGKDGHSIVWKLANAGGESPATDDDPEPAEWVGLVAGHEVRTRLREEGVEPVLAGHVHAVPVLDGRRELVGVDGRHVVVVEAHRRGVVGAGHREVGEVAHAGLVLHALGAL